MPVLVVHDKKLNQNTDLSPAFSWVVPAGGAEYGISIVCEVVSGIPAGSVVLNWTDESGANEESFDVDSQKPLTIHAAAGTTGSINTRDTQSAGGLVYNLFYTVTQLG